MTINEELNFYNMYPKLHNIIIQFTYLTQINIPQMNEMCVFGALCYNSGYSLLLSSKLCKLIVLKISIDIID